MAERASRRASRSRESRLASARPNAGADAIFVAAYEANHADIRRRCLAILHDAAEAEDATEETFTRAWKALVAGEISEEMRPWLRHVARNVCYDVCRRRSKLRPVEGPKIEAATPSAESSERHALRHVEDAFVRECVAEMPDHYQTVLRLREQYGLSYEEIAQHEEIPISAVESRLYRARIALRDHVLALVGPDGVLTALAWNLRQRAGNSMIMGSTLGHASEQLSPEVASSAAAPVGAIASAVAATAVAAVGAVGAVHLVSHPHHQTTPPAATTSTITQHAPTPRLAIAPARTSADAWHHRAEWLAHHRRTRHAFHFVAPAIIYISSSTPSAPATPVTTPPSPAAPAPSVPADPSDTTASTSATSNASTSATPGTTGVTAGTNGSLSATSTVGSVTSTHTGTTTVATTSKTVTSTTLPAASRSVTTTTVAPSKAATSTTKPATTTVPPAKSVTTTPVAPSKAKPATTTTAPPSKTATSTTKPATTTAPPAKSATSTTKPATTTVSPAKSVTTTTVAPSKAKPATTTTLPPAPQSLPAVPSPVTISHPVTEAPTPPTTTTEPVVHPTPLSALPTKSITPPSRGQFLG
jgi:RNA polymerase sigma factor (sigma-70 family)